jgi:hypothetical protein
MVSARKFFGRSDQHLRTLVRGPDLELDSCRTFPPLERGKARDRTTGSRGTYRSNPPKFAGRRFVPHQLRNPDVIREIRPRGVRAEIVECQRKSRVNGDNRCNGPATGNCIHSSIHIVAEPLAAAEWDVVNRIGAKDILGVEEAGLPVGLGS